MYMIYIVVLKTKHVLKNTHNFAQMRLFIYEYQCEKYNYASSYKCIAFRYHSKVHHLLAWFLFGFYYFISPLWHCGERKPLVVKMTKVKTMESTRPSESHTVLPSLVLTALHAVTL